jgi:hypothetical protein
MISNKSDLAHERRRPRGVIGTILSAAASSAILSAAPAMAQIPMQHVAPAMQDKATPVQPLPGPAGSGLTCYELAPSHRQARVRAGNRGGETCVSNK